MKLRKMPIYVTDANGVKRKILSAKWYGVFVDFAGALRRLPLLEDRRASDELARTVNQLNSQRSSGGVLPPDLARAVEAMPGTMVKTLAKWDIIPAAKVAASKPLSEHVADWKAAIVAKGGTENHAATSASRVQRIMAGCGFATQSDVSASKVQSFIAGLRQDSRNAKGDIKRGISAASFNYYLRDARSFFRWMVQDGRCHESPLAHLKGVKTGADRRHERRALTADEMRWLLDTTEHGPDRYGMNGPTRAMLYRLASESGLRAGEIRSLTRASFQLDTDEPTVTIAAAYAKNRRQDQLPLRRSTATALAKYLAGKLPAATAFPLPKKDRIIEMMQADLDAARTAWLKSHRIDAERLKAEETTFLFYRDDAGRCADFHALRHTFISNLAAGGVHPKVAQRLARHSTITLTMDRYTHLRRDDFASALETLPDLAGPVREIVLATGTNDAVASGGKFVSPSLSPNRAIQCNSTQRGAINSMTLADNESIGKMRENSDFPDGNSAHGLLAELADAMDSKSISQKEYRFKSDRGHHSSPACGNAGKSHTW